MGVSIFKEVVLELRLEGRVGKSIVGRGDSRVKVFREE